VVRWAGTLENAALALGLGGAALAAAIVAWRSVGWLPVGGLFIAVALEMAWFSLSAGVSAFLFRPWTAF
jgi:hypothetical protein